MLQLNLIALYTEMPFLFAVVAHFLSGWAWLSRVWPFSTVRTFAVGWLVLITLGRLIFLGKHLLGDSTFGWEWLLHKSMVISCLVCLPPLRVACSSWTASRCLLHGQIGVYMLVGNSQFAPLGHISVCSPVFPY